MTSKFLVYRIFTAPFVLVAMSNVITNVFLIHALRKKKMLKTISYRFILYLSISDTCIGILILITQLIVNLVTSMRLLKTLETCTAALLYSFCQFSGFMILAIAIDRYIHMKYLTNYNVIMTVCRGRMMVCFNIAISILITLIILCGHLYGFIFPAMLFFNVIVLAVLVSITAVYAKAYRSVKSRTDQMELDNGPGNSSRRNSNKEFSKAVLLVLTSLLICYTPYIIFSTLRHRNHHSSSKFALLAGFTSLLLTYVNSTINAIIVLLLNRPLKNYLLSLLSFLRKNRVVEFNG